MWLLACLLWACGGRAPVDAAATVDAGPGADAGLTQAKRTLWVVRSGAGSVRSTPPGIDCGGTCTADFDRGSTVALTAAPDPGWRFVGWSGACRGSSACTVSLADATKVVYANFQAAAPGGG
ncbi:MAG: hypothetical protein NVSMB23_27080 [Myxococcales bacterium]